MLRLRFAFTVLGINDTFCLCSVANRCAMEALVERCTLFRKLFRCVVRYVVKDAAAAGLILLIGARIFCIGNIGFVGK